MYLKPAETEHAPLTSKTAPLADEVYNSMLPGVKYDVGTLWAAFHQLGMSKRVEGEEYRYSNICDDVKPQVLSAYLRKKSDIAEWRTSHARGLMRVDNSPEPR